MFDFLKKKKKSGENDTAAVFVDFEHWCYSLDGVFSLRPDTEAFYNAISARFDIKRLYFFGDFTQVKLRAELDNIRKITNNIIDTQNAQSYVTKDFTDFIMLDYIYQDIDVNPDTDTYIIFSGDGHFASVVGYLKNKKKKKVIVYGVQKSTSNKLKAVATECIEVPSDADENTRYFRMILKNFRLLEERENKGYATFKTTVQVVSKINRVSFNDIKNALLILIEEGVVEKYRAEISSTVVINALRVNWDKAEEKKLWYKNEKV